MFVVVTLAPIFEACEILKDDASAILASRSNAPDTDISPTPLVPPTIPENKTSSPALLIVISLLVESLELTVLPKVILALSVVKIVLPDNEVAPLYVWVPSVLIVPTNVLVPVTFKTALVLSAALFTIRLPVPAPVIFKLAIVKVFCKSNVPVAAIVKPPVPKSPSPPTIIFPALIVVPPS